MRQLQSEGLTVAGTACHVGDRSQLQKLIQFTLDTFGGLDILVSNAAVNPASGPIMTMEVSDPAPAGVGGSSQWLAAVGSGCRMRVSSWQAGLNPLCYSISCLPSPCSLPPAADLPVAAALPPATAPPMLLLLPAPCPLPAAGLCY